MVRQTGKPEIARLEVTLFQMLEGTLRIELGVARQMHLAILADDFCVPVDQDRRVEMMTISGELGVTERQSDAILGGLFEQRTRGGVRHLAFEPDIDFRLVGHVPAREKRRQRKLRIDDEVAPFSLGLLEEIEHPPHNHLPAIRLLARAHLGAADAQHSAHDVLLPWPPPLQRADQAYDRPEHNKIDSAARLRA